MQQQQGSGQQQAPPAPKPLPPQALEEPRQAGVGDVTVNLPEHLPSIVLIASESYLRLYDVRTLSVGDRSTLRKVQLTGQLLAASTFQVQGSPGLCCIVRHGAASATLQVGLQLVLLHSWSACSGHVLAGPLPAHTPVC